jgi:hypothetical protein
MLTHIKARPVPAGSVPSSGTEDVMPVETIVVVSAIIAAFLIFGVTLAIVERRTRNFNSSNFRSN